MNLRYDKSKIFVPVILLSSVFSVSAQQTDSLKKNKPDSLSKIHIGINEKEKDFTLKGTRITEEIDSSFSPSGKLIFSGYISAYYASYTDTASATGFQKFPTIAPRNNVFGLNLLQFSAKYTSQKFRGTFTLHFGDIPQSCWSPQYNMIQEANVGVRICPKLWFDAGFFRTHIGLESIQPRENITMSLATTTFFEPYYLSGAKLTWQPTSRLTLQLNAFNSFNTFVETNKNKAFGFSAVYEVTSKLSFTFSTITSDESPDRFPRRQQRLYNNLYMVYRTKKITVGAEVNYCVQQHSQLADTMASANVLSGLVVLKYNFTKKFACYTRGEFYKDKNEILTGPVIDQNNKLDGLDIMGATFGIEIKSISNSYIRFEGRALQSADNEKIFYYNNRSVSRRYEGIAAIGVWF